VQDLATVFISVIF